jgi:hypothetical protein
MAHMGTVIRFGLLLVALIYRCDEIPSEKYAKYGKHIYLSLLRVDNYDSPLHLGQVLQQRSEWFYAGLRLVEIQAETDRPVVYQLVVVGRNIFRLFLVEAPDGKHLCLVSEKT